MDPSTEDLIVELYGDRKMSTRKVRDELLKRGIRVSHQTVATVAKERGVIRGRPEAALFRRVYPRPWTCANCGAEQLAETHKQYRRKTCSDECASALRGRSTGQDDAS